jgi:hypothetical protein
MAVVGFGRIGEEGSVDGHLFPVSVGVRSLNSECQLKRGSETGHPSLWEHFLGEPGGDSLSGGHEGYEGRLWRWASLFIGAQLGNLEREPLLGTL